MRKPFIAVIRQFLRPALYPLIICSNTVLCYLVSYYNKNSHLSMRAGTIFVQPITYFQLSGSHKNLWHEWLFTLGHLLCWVLNKQFILSSQQPRRVDIISPISHFYLPKSVSFLNSACDVSIFVCFMLPQKSSTHIGGWLIIENVKFWHNQIEMIVPEDIAESARSSNLAVTWIWLWISILLPTSQICEPRQAL